MLEKEQELYQLSMGILLALMPALCLSFYMNSWWPTGAIACSLLLVLSYIMLPIRLLERFKESPRSFNLYAHNIESLLDYLPIFGKRPQAKPDVPAIWAELRSLTLLLVLIFVPYVACFYGFMWLKAEYFGQELFIKFSWPNALYQLVLTQIFVVALPEEFFWRGFVQSIMLKKWPKQHFFLGLPFGKALIFTNLLFALAHFVLGFNAARLLTFFPGMVFSWLVWRNKSLLSAILFHAACNVLEVFLFLSLQAPLVE